jgi:hypothetical protein
MRVLCVGRHAFLSGHLCQFFAELGLDPQPAVGLECAMELARQHRPDAVICDYDLLTSASLEQWECDPAMANLALIAVSLTRRPEDVYALDGTPVAGFLYLPTLERADALRILSAARRSSGVAAPSSLPWPGAQSPLFR